MIGIFTSVPFPTIDMYMGNLINLAFESNTWCEHNYDPLNFWDRLKNTVESLCLVLKMNTISKIQTDMMRKYISPDIPDIEEIRRSYDLMLINTHFSVSGARPLVNRYVEVAGIHVEMNDENKMPLVRHI